MYFWKMNGAGNDFIIINNTNNFLIQNSYSRIASTVCERHLSIGADGLMIIEPSSIADLRMRFFNSDGSEGEMCGNGARCICRYAFENHYSNSEQRIETTAGIITGYRINECDYRIRLNDPSTIKTYNQIDIDGLFFNITYIELGQPGIPHAMVEVSNEQILHPESLLSVGRRIRSYIAFPKGANVNFYSIIDRSNIKILTYERGVEDFTYACGTGTGATALSLFLTGKTSESVTAYMRGGSLKIDIDTDVQNHIKNIWLTGPTNVVAKGEITDSNIIIKEI